MLVMTRDVSQGGLCWLHARPMLAEHYALKLPAQAVDSIQVIVKVVRHCIRRRFHEYGGEFVVKMGNELSGNHTRKGSTSSDSD